MVTRLEDDWINIADKFYSRRTFPIIGAIDGTACTDDTTKTLRHILTTRNYFLAF